MAYSDRFTLTVKDFGRKVVISTNRGRIVTSNRGMTATITYKDSPVRGLRKSR
jgi:hypothetical protein